MRDHSRDLRAEPAARSIEDRLFRALAVLRAVLAANVVGVNAFRSETVEHPRLLVTAVVVMVAWTALTAWWYADTDRRTPTALGLDLAVAVGFLLATPAVVGEGWGATLPGFWVMAPMLAWAARWRHVGGLVAGLLVGGADVAVREELNRASYGNVFLLVIGGPIVGYLVASLQRAASAPLEIEMVDPDEFLASERSGLFVGADYADSVAFEAPLRLDGMRLLDYAEAEFQVGSEQPFAALETLRQNGRHVVMLGAWSPDDGSLPTTLTRAAVTEAAELGWSTLTDDLLVASEGVEPFTLSTNAVVPQEERVEEERSYAWWFVGGVAVLLVLLAVQLMATVRKDRRVRALVDAQEEHDRELEDEPGTASTGSSTDQH